MSNRLDKDREIELNPKRMAFAKNVITHLGYEITFESEKELRFIFKGETVYCFPFTGWHTGKSITDGRGIQKLINQIKQK
jgi:hypothetical protein